VAGHVQCEPRIRFFLRRELFRLVLSFCAVRRVAEPPMVRTCPWTSGYPFEEPFLSCILFAFTFGGLQDNHFALSRTDRSELASTVVVRPERRESHPSRRQTRAILNQYGARSHDRVSADMPFQIGPPTGGIFSAPGVIPPQCCNLIPNAVLLLKQKIFPFNKVFQTKLHF